MRFRLRPLWVFGSGRPGSTRASVYSSLSRKVPESSLRRRASTVRVGVTSPVEDGLSVNDFVQIAVEAEELGYDTVVGGEVAGAEVMATLGTMAARTDRVRRRPG